MSVVQTAPEISENSDFGTFADWLVFPALNTDCTKGVMEETPNTWLPIEPIQGYLKMSL